MSTYQMSAPANDRSNGMDVAAWALVALVVALICAGAGWAIARNDAPGRDDVARTAELAGRDGMMRGEQQGYVQGAAAGRREAAMRTRSEVAAARREGARAGNQEGYNTGRFNAGDPDAFSSAGLGSSGAYPAAGYEDILASGALGGADVPGYSSSAFDAYGSSASSPYAGASSMNGPGDSY